MNTKHTPGKLTVAKGIAGKPYSYSEKGMPGHHAILDGEEYGVARVAGETSKQCLANAERLAMCWNMHDEMAAALRGMVEAEDKLLAGDLPPLVKAHVASVLRTNTARAVLAKLEGGEK